MTEANRRPHLSRLSVRFAVILALALLPAGFIAFVQTTALEDELQRRGEIALIGSTAKAAADETALISRVRGTLGSLALVVPIIDDDTETCSSLMRRIAESEPTATVVGFVPANGVMVCSSTGSGQDYSDYPLFHEIVKAAEPYIFAFPNGPVSGTSVLGITHPVFGQSGNYLGYVVVSIAHERLREMGFSDFLERSGLEVPVTYWTFDRSGTLLTSNIDLEETQRKIPFDQPLNSFVGTQPDVFHAKSVDGSEMTYAVAPVIDGELYLMSSFVPERTGFFFTHGSAAFLPTLLMWLAGLLASGLAAELLVTRHVRTLNRSILSFAEGDRRLQSIDLRNAPTELNELAAAYLAMTESVTRSEAELEDSLHQKEVLLREVHHRVKNNLQLISSIMNIQIRSARSDEARTFLRNLQERIMSLATVHRGLYQTSGLADVRARELIPDIVRQIMSMSSGPDKPFLTQNDIDDLRLVPDQAVPLSLLLTEALTNAMKHAGATREHPGNLTVRLKRSGGSGAVLEVINTVRERSAPHNDMPDTGLGSQLIAAFVQQLGGRQESGTTDGNYWLKVHFEVSPLSLAESLPPSENSDST